MSLWRLLSRRITTDIRLGDLYDTSFTVRKGIDEKGAPETAFKRSEEMFRVFGEETTKRFFSEFCHDMIFVSHFMHLLRQPASLTAHSPKFQHVSHWEYHRPLSKFESGFDLIFNSKTEQL